MPLSAATATLSSYADVRFRQPVTARAFANSILIASTAELLIVALAILLGHFMTPGSRIASALHV